ncbi:MAG: hypothetical protein RLY72_1310, partial [Planctomycetota bacterium]
DDRIADRCQRVVRLKDGAVEYDRIGARRGFTAKHEGAHGAAHGAAHGGAHA